MCLIVFGWQTDPELRLALAGNRDEFYRRPAQAMHWWADRPDVLAGRDLQAGGTWLAMHRSGRFAAVTNYREHRRPASGASSRGALVTDFVDGDARPDDFAAAIGNGDYAGFSLLLSDGETLWYVSNRGDEPKALAPGFYGLSNASLDTPWPKLTRLRDRLEALAEDEAVNETGLLRLMADTTTASVDETVAGDLPFELARAMTAPFIVTPEYGTRCSTALVWPSSGPVRVIERSFDENGRKTGDAAFRFDIERA